MNDERYQQIVEFLQDGNIPDSIEHKSNFRKLCRKFILGSESEYGILYFQKQVTTPTYVIRPECADKPVEDLVSGVDYITQDTKITILYKVVKEDVLEELLAGCVQFSVRSIISPNYCS